MSESIIEIQSLNPEGISQSGVRGEIINISKLGRGRPRKYYTEEEIKKNTTIKNKMTYERRKRELQKWKSVVSDAQSRLITMLQKTVYNDESCIEKMNNLIEYLETVDKF